MKIETYLVTILWLITVLVWWQERRKNKIIRKNSEWAIVKSRQKAEKIIEEAKDAALKELADVKVETKKYEDQLESGVKKLTDQEISQYKDIISGITADIESGVKNDSAKFKEEFDKAWKEMDENMRKKIDQDYTEERIKLKDYTDKKMRELEERASDMADKAILAVMAKQVDTETNKRMIKEALEELKKEYEER